MKRFKIHLNGLDKFEDLYEEIEFIYKLFPELVKAQYIFNLSKVNKILKKNF